MAVAAAGEVVVGEDAGVAEDVVEEADGAVEEANSVNLKRKQPINAKEAQV